MNLVFQERKIDMKKTILLIEDDSAIIRLLKVALETNDYKVIVAKTAIEGISLFLSERPDLILLDLGLPDVDGMEVVSQVREISKTPIIVVSARSNENEKVAALDSGADDYVTKPFNVKELLARIRVSLRKSINENDLNTVFEKNNLKIDFDKYQAFLNDEAIHFTPIEFKILKLLIDNRGKVLTHKFIQNEIWGYESLDEYQSLRVYMAALRKKIEKDTSKPEYIVTEIGVGYRFVE